jgi:hypothetical protein
LTITHRSANRDIAEARWRGTFSLSEGVERKLFDFVGTTPAGKPVEFLGIYEFEDEAVKFCDGIRHDAHDRNFKRPDSFAVGLGIPRQFRKLRRLGDP